MSDFPRILQSDRDAAGLVACYVAIPGGMMELVSGTIGTAGGNAGPNRSNEFGTLDSYFDGNGDSFGFGTTGLVSPSDPFTFVWESYLDSFVDSYPFVGHIALTSGTKRWRCSYSSDANYNDISFGFVATGETFRAVLMPSGITQTGMRHWGVITFDGANTLADSSYKVWINGQACTFTTASTAGSTTSENRIGGTSATTTDFNGAIRQVRVYNREWSEGDAIRFFQPSSRDSLFKAKNRRTYSFSTGAAPSIVGPLIRSRLVGHSPLIQGRLL